MYIIEKVVSFVVCSHTMGGAAPMQDTSLQLAASLGPVPYPKTLRHVVGKWYQSASPQECNISNVVFT